MQIVPTIDVCAAGVIRSPSCGNGMTAEEVLVAAAAGCWGSVCCRAAPDAPNEPDAPDVTMPGSTRALMTTATVVRPADRILTPYSGRAPSGASSAYTAVWEKSPNE